MAVKTSSKGKLRPRPYARLLTMIGEQLIKNEKVALIELIKNSYDADASWVQIRFNNFEKEKDDANNLIVTNKSTIEIEDDGIGMNFKTIKDSWMNPATPTKLIEKTKGIRKSRIKKRIIQGEKGIGRYATFKLGKKVEIITKSVGKKEIALSNDLTKYEEEIVTIKGSKELLYLDQLEFDYEIRQKKEHFLSSELIIRGIKKTRVDHGTLIRISNLNNNWTKDKIEEIFYDILRLESPFSGSKTKKDFIVDFKLNDMPFILDKLVDKNIEEIFDSAPIRVTSGNFDGKVINFLINKQNIKLTFDALKENKDFYKRFFGKDKKLKRKPECGPFDFEFYIFDLSKNPPKKYQLDPEAKKLVKGNRIYLYRDGIRVFPYGDPDDDWLGVDIKRGTSRAGFHLSNDQTIGMIKISGENNPKLKDKTNREGLLEIGNSYEDFRVILLSILGYLHKEYKKYKSSAEMSELNISIKSNELLREFNDSLEQINKNHPSNAKNILSRAINKYKNEKKYLIERAETSEDLASVGLAVEIASHDLMMMIRRATNTIDFILKSIDNGNFDLTTLKTNIETLRDQVSFVEDQIEGIQPIFKSSKRRKKDFRIKDLIERIKKYFIGDIEKNKIDVRIEENDLPLVVNSNEAVLLQTLINLFDNSIYWLSRSDIEKRKIIISLSGNENSMIFSDNGPGVRVDDINYIFEPFFTTKGIDGRGLGLYITDQLLQRYDHSIEYINKDKILPGANFLINFSNN